MGNRVLKIFKMPPYPYWFHLAVGKEELDYVQEKKGFSIGNVDPFLGAVFSMTDSNGGGFGLLYLQDLEDEDTLWHESLHLVHQMMDAMGVPICHSNTEVVAYTQEYVVKVCRKEIVARLKKRRLTGE